MTALKARLSQLQATFLPDHYSNYFSNVFFALALSLPQRKQAAVPPLLAACPGQVVQGVVYAQ